MKRFMLALLPLMAASTYADTQSNSGFYVGGGASSVKNDWDDTKWSPVEIFGGYKLNPFVGGEVRIGKSVGGSIKIKDYEALYYRVESANSVGKTYLLAGYSRAKIEKMTFDGISYGAGVGFVINDRFNLNLEYRMLLNGSDKYKDDIELSSLGITLDYRFDHFGSFGMSSSNSGGYSGGSTNSNSGGNSAGPYIFANIGFTELNITPDAEDGDDYGATDQINGFSIGGGYKINDLFAVEVAYRDLGTLDESEEDITASTDVTALQVSGIASYSINDSFTAYGRLGIADLTLKASYKDAEESGSASISKNRIVYGIGGRYALNDRMGVRFEVDQFAKWSELALTVTTASLGVDYHF